MSARDVREMLDITAPGRKAYHWRLVIVVEFRLPRRPGGKYDPRASFWSFQVVRSNLFDPQQKRDAWQAEALFLDDFRTAVIDQRLLLRKHYPEARRHFVIQARHWDIWRTAVDLTSTANEIEQLLDEEDETLPECRFSEEES